MRMETVSPERAEVERQAEYFELEYTRRRATVTWTASMIGLVVVLALLSLLGGWR